MKNKTWVVSKTKAAILRDNAKVDGRDKEAQKQSARQVGSCRWSAILTTETLTCSNHNTSLFLFWWISSYKLPRSWWRVLGRVWFDVITRNEWKNLMCEAVGEAAMVYKNGNQRDASEESKLCHFYTTYSHIMFIQVYYVSTHLGCEFSSYMRSFPSLNKLMVCLVFLVRFSIKTRKYSLSPKVSILPS